MVAGDHLMTINSSTGEVSLEDLETTGFEAGVTLPSGVTWLNYNWTSVYILDGGVLTLLPFTFDFVEPLCYDSVNDRVFIGHALGIEVFDASTQDHLMTLTNPPFRQATCLCMAPGSTSVLMTFGANDIIAVDIASNTWSTFAEIEPLADPETGAEEFFQIFALNQYFGIYILALLPTSFGRERLWVYLWDSAGAVAAALPIAEKLVTVPIEDYFSVFDTVWESDFSLAYFSAYDGDKLASFNPADLSLNWDVVPDLDAQYDAAGGVFYPDRPSWDYMWKGAAIAPPPPPTAFGRSVRKRQVDI